MSSSCIGLLDRFLQKSIVEGPGGFVTQKNLQLIAVATFLIAAKVEVNLRRMEIEIEALMDRHLGNTPSSCR